MTGGDIRKSQLNKRKNITGIQEADYAICLVRVQPHIVKPTMLQQEQECFEAILEDSSSFLLALPRLFWMVF